MAHEISGICICQLCGEKFIGPANLMIIGRDHDEDRRLEQLISKMMTHLREKHRDEWGVIELSKEEYAGMLRLRNFRLPDKTASQQRDFLRWQVHQGTIITDLKPEAIQQAAAHLEGKPAADIAAALTELRDQLLERGRYQIEQPPQTRQVTPPEAENPPRVS